MKNTITLLFAKVFEKGIMFLFFILLAHSFGKSAVGEFSYYYSVVVILFVLLDLGGDFYQIREFSKKESLKNFNTIFVLKTVLFILLFTTMILFFTSNIYILLFFSSYYLGSVISIFRSSLYTHGYYILESKYTIFEKSIFLIIIVANIISIESLLIIYFSFLLSKIAYILILLKKFYKFNYILNIKKLFDMNFAKEYMYGSWSYILHSLLVVVFVQIDIIMLKHMGIPYEDIGLYSVALKIYAIAIIFADVLFKQYYPIVTKYVQLNEKNKLKKFILKVQDANLFFSIYFVTIIILFADEIIYFTFGNEFIEASKMLTLLSIIIIFRFSMYTYTALLSSSTLNYIKIYTSLGCAILNIILNYFLIPIYGVYGAIIATIITELVLVISFKLTSLKIVFTNYLKFNEFVIFILTLTFSIYFYVTQVNIVYKFLLLGIILLSLIFQKNKIKKYLSPRSY